MARYGCWYLRENVSTLGVLFKVRPDDLWGLVFEGSSDGESHKGEGNNDLKYI